MNPEHRPSFIYMLILNFCKVGHQVYIDHTQIQYAYPARIGEQLIAAESLIRFVYNSRRSIQLIYWLSRNKAAADVRSNDVAAWYFPTVPI